MTLNFNPADDLAAVADGTETITYHRRGATPGGAGTSLVGVVRSALSLGEPTTANRIDVRRPRDAGGRVIQHDAAWHLPADALSESPRPGDLIVDSQSQRWTVLQVWSVVLGGRWRCIARNMAVAHHLDDTIDVLVAQFAKGDGGALEPNWRTWRTGVRARMQPMGTIADAPDGSRGLARRVRVFTADDLPLDHTHRLRTRDGTIYRVVASVGAERIGELQTIEAERIPT